MRGQKPVSNDYTVIDMFKFEIVQGDCNPPLIDDITIKFCNIYTNCYKDIFYHVPHGQHIIMRCGTMETGVRYCYQDENNRTRYFFPCIAPHIIACHREQVSKRDLDIISKWPYGQFDYVNNSTIRYNWAANRDMLLWRTDGKGKGTYNPFNPLANPYLKDKSKLIPVPPVSSSAFKPVRREVAQAPIGPSPINLPFSFLPGSKNQTREYISHLMLSGEEGEAEVLFNGKAMLFDIRFHNGKFQYWFNDTWNNFTPVFLVVK